MRVLFRTIGFSLAIAFQHLTETRFLNVVPLIEWLRALSDLRQWKFPPLRACFMFDDPNLHSERYGFICF